jgi:hypothetical protein
MSAPPGGFRLGYPTVGAAIAALAPSSGWTEINIAAAVDTVTFSGLDGDTDGAYEFEGQFINDDAGTAAYSFRPNDLTTDQKQQDIFADSSDVVIAERDTLLDLTFLGPGAKATFHGYFWARSGKFRFFECDSIAVSALGTYIGEIFSRAVWLDDATNVTSGVFHSSAASGVGVGSVIRWRKIGATASAAAVTGVPLILSGSFTFAPGLSELVLANPAITVNSYVIAMPTVAMASGLVIAYTRVVSGNAVVAIDNTTGASIGPFTTTFRLLALAVP